MSTLHTREQEGLIPPAWSIVSQRRQDAEEREDMHPSKCIGSILFRFYTGFFKETADGRRQY
jgi:hypothetical protein